MDIREMDLEMIETRKAELRAKDLEKLTNEELDSITAELDQLEARANELKEMAEKRNALAKKIENAEPANLEKPFTEEKNMEERTFAIDSVEYRDAYMKQLQGKPMSVEERTALTSAASVIPTQTVNKIYGLLEQNPLIAEVDALHIPGYVAVPAATAVNDANWVAMDTAATDSADTVGSVALSAYKLIKTIEITADIKAMSIPAFESWLVNKLAQKMEAAICKAIIVGTGSGQPTGIGATTGLAGSTAIVGATVAKLAALVAGLKTAYHKNAVFIMSANTFYTQIVPMANDSNGVVVMNGLEARLLGHKIVLDENVDNCKFTGESANKNHIIFGSLNDGYVFNYGEGINIEADQSVAFRSGSTVYRAMALCDGKVVDKAAFVWADISAS